MHNKRFTPALAGLFALSFALGAQAGVDPTVVRESGSDNRQLFAPIGNRTGRLEWSPSAGWAGTWALHPNNSGVAVHEWRNHFTALSWYDINVRPTGLVGGPQIESHVGYYRAGQPRLGRFRLSGDYGTSYQWNPHWSFELPPGGVTDGFYPRAGYVWFDNGVYRRHPPCRATRRTAASSSGRTARRATRRTGTPGCLPPRTRCPRLSPSRDSLPANTTPPGRPGSG